MDDLTGRIFGRWKVLEFSHSEKGTQVWVVECSCGNIRKTRKGALVKGESQSCGCLKREKERKRMTTHGRSRDPAFSSVKRAIDRCCNPKHPAYKNYGGRGISVFKEWIDDPIKFADYIGPRPSNKHSLDRINNDGNYEPGNVRWATDEEQSNNRRSTKYIEIDGISKPFPEWCRIYKIDRKVCADRIRRGYSPKEALTLQLDLKTRKLSHLSDKPV